MVDGYPKDPMHFLAKMTKGKLVSAKNVKDLSSERQSRFNEVLSLELSLKAKIVKKPFSMTNEL